MLSPRETAALEACWANLDKIEPDPSAPSDDPTCGRCYAASAALQVYLGGPKEGYSLVKAAATQLSYYYWVVNEYGAILDPVKKLLDAAGVEPPYRLGRKTSRRNTLTRHLPLLDAMRESLKDDSRVNGSRPAVDIVGRPLVVPREAALSDDQQARLASAWRALASDWASRPEEFIRCTFPKGEMAIYFVRALLYGEKIPRTATMAYTWERYYVAGSHYPFSDMLPAALENPNVLRGMRFTLGDEMSFRKLIASNLPIGGYRIPADFPVELAKELINKYCPSGGAVLDPCHGWGGRMVGFMLSTAAAYVGVDPAPHGCKLREMFDDLSVYLDHPKQLKLINKPFEDVALRPGFYDFALTSPPYFNVEKYQGEESSWQRYKTLDQWIDGFYRPLLTGVSEALKPGAAFALQITPKFDLVNIAKQIGSEIGLIYERAGETTAMQRRYNSASADKAGSTDLFEAVVIFRRA